MPRITASPNPVSLAGKPSILHLILRQIRAGVTHPAGLVFLLIWLAGVTMLLVRGRVLLVQEVIGRLILFNAIPIVLLLRRTPPSPESDPPRHRRAALWGQVAFLVALMVLSMVTLMGYLEVIPAK